MNPSIRRLGPDDEAILELLAKEEADFDLHGRGKPLQPLDSEAARLYLTNPSVLHWVALEEGKAIGHLYCVLLPLRSGEGRELLLYEIGVRSSWRKHGIGRALLNCMEGWMRIASVRTAWVLADNEVAVKFYRACGFKTEETQPVYMVLELPE